MRNTKITFKKDLDELWNEKDEDANGFLNIEEAREFLIELRKLI